MTAFTQDSGWIQPAALTRATFRRGHGGTYGGLISRSRLGVPSDQCRQPTGRHRSGE